MTKNNEAIQVKLHWFDSCIANRKGKTPVFDGRLSEEAAEFLFLILAENAQKNAYYQQDHTDHNEDGAGIGGAGEHGAGGSEVYEVNVRAVFMEPGEVQIWVSPDNIHQYMQDLAMLDPDASFGGQFAYVYSDIFTLAIKLNNAVVTGFHVASDFVADFKDAQPTRTTTN